MAKIERIAEPMRGVSSPPSDKINSPFKGITGFTQNAETVEALRQKIPERCYSGFRQRLFLILLDHLEHGLHKKTLMDAYEKKYKRQIFEDEINVLSLFFREPANSFALSPKHPFYLEMYKGWFRIVPPGYNVRGLIDADKKGKVDGEVAAVREKIGKV